MALKKHTLYLPEYLIEDIKAEAQEIGISASELIRDYIKWGLDRRPQVRKKNEHR